MHSSASQETASAIPDGWIVVVNNTTQKDLLVSSLSFVTFVQEEERITVDSACWRATRMSGVLELSLEDGLKIIEQQDKLPTDLRGKYILLTGTKLRGPDNRDEMPCLYWDKRKEVWSVYFRSYDYKYCDKNDVLPCSK